VDISSRAGKISGVKTIKNGMVKRLIEHTDKTLGNRQTEVSPFLGMPHTL